MRKRLAWIRNVPFRKLQLRIMVYFLVFGLIPIICTIVYFHLQATSASRTELAYQVNVSQKSVVSLLEMEIRQLEKKAMAINHDAEVQRMLGETALSLTTKDSELLPYLYSMIPLWKIGSLQGSDICFSFYSSNTSVCGDSSILQLEQSLFNSKDKRIDQVTTSNGEGKLLRYIAPLFVRHSESIQGHMVMIIDLKPILSKMNVLDYPSEIIITDPLGNTLFEHLDPKFISRDEHVESEKTIRVLSDQWLFKMSVLNVKYEEYQSRLAIIAILLIPLLLILSIMGAFIFSRILTKPLQYLRSLMKRAELGDLKAYWTYKSSQDIDELGESYNQMLNRLEDVIKQVKVEETLKKEKEFEALQYQLNPHFLYNTLNTIKWVAKIHKTPQISEVVSALVRLLQVSLNKKGDFITVREEVGLVKDYMDIQTFRYGETIQIETVIESLAAQCLVPKMILQPLVENAIIHGLELSSKEDKRIVIRAWIERDLLFCQVEDNGRGLDQEQLLSLDKPNKREGIKERLSGIGLKHIREKIRLYYGPDYSMQIFSKPNQGTTIRLSLPIHQSEG